MRPLFPGPLGLASFVVLLALGSSAATSQETKEGSESDLREQTIYVPYAELRDVFEKEGRGVFLPYEQFQKLWESARNSDGVESQSQPNLAKPPEAIISEITSEATVRKDVVQVEAELTIELLRKGWNTIPLRLGDAAIQSAKIADEVARVTTAPDGGYQLVIDNQNDEPNTVTLNLTYVRAFDKSPGQNRVAFAAPQAPVNRWKIRVPGEGVKVNVDPMIAATEEESESDQEDGDEGETKETILLAFVGSAAEVSIRWTAKSEGATGLTALTSVQAIQEVFVSEGAVRTRTNLTYSISRAQINRLVVEVPADEKVVNVFDPNIRKWDVAGSGELQTITVDLFEPATSTQNLTIELEKFIDESMMNDIKTPMVRAVDVARQQGTLVVKATPALRTETTNRAGLLQVDAAELPASIAKQAWALAYRYASTPFELSLAVEKIRPRIDVQQLVECYLEPERLSIDSFVIYDIQQAGVFELALDLPDGFEVVQVVGRAGSNIGAANVDSFRVEGDQEKRLIVDLTRRAIGKIGLWVQLRKPLSDANLLSPTNAASTIALPVPEANQQFREQFSGRYVVYAPDSLRLNPATTEGLRAISFAEAFQPVPSPRDGRFPTTRPTLAFTFSEQATNLTIEAERRNPYVTARQAVVVRVDSGVVKFEVTLIYQINYSGVKSLRIDVPESVAADVRNVSGPIRDAVIEPAPDDLDEGYVAWDLTAGSELIGTHRVRFTWDQTIDELAVGSSVDLPIPRFIPRGADRAWGQIIVTKGETLDVQPTEERVGLRPIDPLHDVMTDVRVPDAAAALEFHDVWNLTLRATRYQLEELKRTSIERSLIRTVVTRSDRQSVAALYRIRSARQRLGIKLPEDAEFDSQPVRINGQPVVLERGDQDLLYIPLIGQDPNGEFNLEVRYGLPGSHRRISIPKFPEDPATQKVYLAVFLPSEISLLQSSGPWSEEFEWGRSGSVGWAPVPNQTDDQLESWVREGIEGSSGPAFQKDGTMFLYSALRPDPPPEGDLRLTAINKNLLSGGVIAIFVVVGLLLLRSSGTKKLASIVLLLIAAVLCGVFMPTLGRQLLSMPTYAALAVVGITWGSWSINRESKRLRLRLGSGAKKAATVQPPENDGEKVEGDSIAKEPPTKKDQEASAEKDAADESGGSPEKNEQGGGDDE